MSLCTGSSWLLASDILVPDVPLPSTPSIPSDRMAAMYAAMIGDAVSSVRNLPRGVGMPPAKRRQQVYHDALWLLGATDRAITLEMACAAVGFSASAVSNAMRALCERRVREFEEQRPMRPASSKVNVRTRAKRVRERW